MFRQSHKVYFSIFCLSLMIGSPAIMAMELKSTAFLNNQMIPKKYTCEGENVSVPLNWAKAPSSTKSFALVVDDPDAPVGVWDHWLIYNIPSDQTSLDEAQKIQSPLLQGKNSWGKMAYGGPCPPSGTHHYHFKLYALSDSLPATSGYTKAALEKLMEGKIIEQTSLVGLYKK